MGDLFEGLSYAQVALRIGNSMWTALKLLGMRRLEMDDAPLVHQQIM